MSKQKPKGRRKHVPLRTCVACGVARPKRSLLRLVRVQGSVVTPPVQAGRLEPPAPEQERGDGRAGASLPAHKIVVDPSGKQAGRGAYLCRDSACWKKALSSNRVLSRALRTSVSEDDRAALLAFLERELAEPGGVSEG